MNKCDIKPYKINYYIPEGSDLDDVTVDQTVITRTRDLTKISLLDWKQEQELCPSCDELYAFANSYYPHTEDADPLSKVNSLLAQSDILQTSKEKEAERRIFTYDAYSEADAQIRYLESTPLSFIILGKPDIGQQELGRELANFWNCVYIEPQLLIEEEMESGSRAGECIEFNLRCGRAIGIDIILKLVDQKVMSDSAKHRGFVLCGLPVIPNDLYEEDPVSSQSAVFTARDIFEEMFTVTADICIAPSNPQVSVSSKYQSEVDNSVKQNVLSEPNNDNMGTSKEQSQEENIGKNYEKQLDFLFNLFKEPYFVIYIQCGTIDVLNKRDSYRFNFALNKTIDMQRRLYNQELKDLLVEHHESIYDNTLEFTELKSEDFRLKHLVKLPLHFKANVSSQLDYYHYAALNFIQNRILAHNPENFIKVDGRTSISRMLSIVKARLSVMNVQKVVVPNKLIGDELDALFKTNETLTGEDVPTPHAEEEKNLTPEICFKQFRKRKVVSGSYLWSWSKWGSKCPVSMKYGFIKEGNVNFPVQFMNKIYFLADQEAYFKFYENPRPFLLPPFPRSTCRIFIFGPKRSGRTSLAHCLAYYFGGTVLCADELINEFMKQRQNEYLEKIKQQAIAEGIALLNKNRALEALELEQSRIEKIKEWVKTVVGLLEEMSNILAEIEKEENKEKFEISSFPMAMKKIQTTDDLEDSEYAIALSAVRDQLQDLHVPINKLDPATWKVFITERRKLFQYLPLELASKYQPKPATVFDDFVKEYVESALANAGVNDMNISGGSILEMFINRIKMADEMYRMQGFARGGWIIDGMMCNLKVVQDFFPDYTGDDIIVLKDSSDYLVKNFKEHKSTFFRDFRNFFTNAGMQEAALRSPSVTSTQKYKEGFARNILQDILDGESFYDTSGEQSSTDHPRVESYRREIQNFVREWSKVSQFYKENNIAVIEIDVSGMSLPELFQKTIETLEERYMYKPSRLTEDDRGEEMLNFVQQNIDDYSERESPTLSQSQPVGENIRKLGDTSHFCPVTLSEDFVLWKGKEDFAVKYNEQIYVLGTEPDMEKFMKDPLKYLPIEHSAKIPPPRICVIGVTGCGKTYLSKSISENYGLIYISYEQFLKECFHISTNDSLNEIRKSSSNPELRSYLNSENSLSDKVLSKIADFWFQEPFKSKGFVFDDFPKRHFDIDFMVKNKLIPDIILYTQADETYLKTKLMDRYLKCWREAMNKQRQDTELKYSNALEKWKEQRSVRFNTLIEERREKRYARKLEDMPQELRTSPEAFTSNMKSTSLVSFDSVADQADIDEVNKILDAELPPITYDAPVENPQAFISETQPFLFNIIELDRSALNLIVDKCSNQQVPLTSLLLDLENFDRTKVAGFLSVEPMKFRNKSYLESCYDVSLDIADGLLRAGYMFLSKFGKTCPVQYYNDKIPVQMYWVAEREQNLYPVAHRSYIYFIIGEKERNIFKENPLKYIHQEFRFPLINFRVAVTGPPKSGKTVLSKRIAKEFGFKLITRGQAVRYVLKYLYQSDLSRNMESVLRKGWELTDEMVMKSVEAVTFHERTVTQGVVFDGFPNNLIETKHLSFLDLIPNIIIDLQADQQYVFECLRALVPPTNLPKYGVAFTKHIYEEWFKESESFRQWFDKEYQAMTKIPITTSNWSVWCLSKKYLDSTFFEIKHYHKHIIDDWPLHLGNMLVTPLEFLERQSIFKSYCPVCLHFSNSLVTGGEPPDRTGLVQYRKYFYWLCDNHIELFLKTPEIYLPPYNEHGMPSNLPKRCTFQSIPENVYEDGSCSVCYKSKRIITKGKLTLCCTFNDKVYLFDSVECLNTFLRNPSMFLFGIDFRAPVYPELKYRDLPILGMLEQYVAKYIVQGTSFIAKRRPILPGLNISQSALIGLGLFIKLKNETPNPLLSYYEEGFRLYNERRDNLKKYLDIMKTYMNPYVYYEEPLAKFQLPPATPKAESLTTMISRIVDQCVDNINIYLQNANESTESED